MDHPQVSIAGDGAAIPSTHYLFDDRIGFSEYNTATTDEVVDASKGPRLTQEQLGFLEQEFLHNYKPNTDHKRALAQRMGVELTKVNVSRYTPRVVTATDTRSQNWFQNRRARAKHENHAQQKVDRSFSDGVPLPGAVPLNYNGITGSQKFTYYPSPEQAHTSLDFNPVAELPHFYAQDAVPPPNHRFDIPEASQPDPSSTVTAHTYAQLPMDDLYNEKVLAHVVPETDAVGIFSTSPPVDSSCFNLTSSNTDWYTQPMYSNLVGEHAVGNPSLQSFETSPSEDNEHTKFITPPQETSPFPRSNQAQFQHDRQTSNSSELAENLDTVHLQTSQVGLGLMEASTDIKPANIQTVTGLPTPEVSPDTVNPKLPFGSGHDLASRRKRPRPAALQPESNRSVSYAGPPTMSPRVRVSPPTSGKMSPVRRIKSTGNNMNVMTGRVKKTGTASAQLSPRNLESCFKVASAPNSRHGSENSTNHHMTAEHHADPINATSPTYSNRRQETWPISPTHVALPSSPCFQGANETVSKVRSSSGPSWNLYQPEPVYSSLVMPPPEPIQSHHFPYHYPPQSAPSHVTTFDAASIMHPGGWPLHSNQTEPYRDDTILAMPCRSNHMQHLSYGGFPSTCHSSDSIFQQYLNPMGGYLSYPPFLNKSPSPVHKVLDIKIETGPPPPKEMIQAALERKEYIFENSFPCDANFKSGSKK